MNTQPHLLEINDLSVIHKSGNRQFQALKGVRLAIAPGETVGLVGESGSGKTTIGKAVLGQTPAAGGHILFDGEDITTPPVNAARNSAASSRLSSRTPSSLNPASTIGDTLAEPLLRDKPGKRRIRAKIADILNG